MTDEQRNDIVNYRIENAVETLKEVLDHCENGYFNTAVNRLYYACYYAATALLVANCIGTKSHDGVRQMLGKEFVLTGKIPVEWEDSTLWHSANEVQETMKTLLLTHVRL